MSQPNYRLRVIKDGNEILTKDYVTLAGAVKAYDRVLTWYNVAPNTPKLSGVCTVREMNGTGVKRSEFKPGFGWY